MKRHFKVRESFSAGFLTSTGLAEGCGLSVYGMLLVDHLFHKWISFQCSPVRSLSYVDDWHVFTWDSQSALRQLDLVVEFATMLDLSVDRRKTVAWSTDPHLRQLLRSQQVTDVHHARELGGHFGVSRQYTNKTVAQRIEALEDLWPKLRMSKARYQAKVYMLRAVAWPRGLHAIASAPIGDNIWTELRRRATHALGLQRPGVNSSVLLGLVEPCTDPQHVALLWTCRAARAVCDLDFWSVPVACAAHGDVDLPPNSVASILLTRLHQVGFTIDRQGYVSDQFGRFSLHHTNSAEVELRLTWGWYRYVAAKVHHRAEFHGLWLADVANTRRALARLGADDQAMLRFGLIGGLFTESYKAKWTSQPDTCRWCGQTDTLSHRYWECIQHADLRQSLAPDVVPIWTQLPPALTLRGWALVPPTWQQWITTLAALPDQVLPPAQPLGLEGWNDVFTDGSCLWQSAACYRLASWAVVLAPPCRSSWTPEATTVLCASVLAGVCQTAFRAEVYAVAYILHWAASTGAAVRIWSDCLGVVNKVKLACKRQLRVAINRPNNDLWQWIVESIEQLGPEKVQIRKVAGHRTLQSATNTVDAWEIFHNNYVDNAAKLANHARPEQFWRQWETHVQETQVAHNLAQQVQALHVAVGRRHVRADTADDRQEVPTTRVTREFATAFSFGQWHGHAFPQTSRLFGGTHVVRVVQWFQARTEGVPLTDVRWVSFAQLYLDYQMCWGLPGPLRVQNQWVDIQQRPHLTTAGFSFRQQLKWFRQLLKAMWKEAAMVVGMAQCRPDTNDHCFCAECFGSLGVTCTHHC